MDRRAASPWDSQRSSTARADEALIGWPDRRRPRTTWRWSSRQAYWSPTQRSASTSRGVRRGIPASRRRRLPRAGASPALEGLPGLPQAGAPAPAVEGFGLLFAFGSSTPPSRISSAPGHELPDPGRLPLPMMMGGEFARRAEGGQEQHLCGSVSRGSPRARRTNRLDPGGPKDPASTPWGVCASGGAATSPSYQPGRLRGSPWRSEALLSLFRPAERDHALRQGALTAERGQAVSGEQLPHLPFVRRGPQQDIGEALLLLVDGAVCPRLLDVLELKAHPASSARVVRPHPRAWRAGSDSSGSSSPPARTWRTSCTAHARGLPGMRSKLRASTSSAGAWWASSPTSWRISSTPGPLFHSTDQTEREGSQLTPT